MVTQWTFKTIAHTAKHLAVYYMFVKAVQRVITVPCTSIYRLTDVGGLWLGGTCNTSRIMRQIMNGLPQCCCWISSERECTKTVQLSTFRFPLWGGNGFFFLRYYRRCSNESKMAIIFVHKLNRSLSKLQLWRKLNSFLTYPSISTRRWSSIAWISHTWGFIKCSMSESGNPAEKCKRFTRTL